MSKLVWILALSGILLGVAPAHGQGLPPGYEYREMECTECGGSIEGNHYYAVTIEKYPEGNFCTKDCARSYMVRERAERGARARDLREAEFLQEKERDKTINFVCAVPVAIVFALIVIQGVYMGIKQAAKRAKRSLEPPPTY